MLYRARLYPFDEIIETEDFKTLYFAVVRRFSMFPADVNFAHVETIGNGRSVCNFFSVEGFNYRHLFLAKSKTRVCLIRSFLYPWAFNLGDKDTTDQLFSWAKDNGYDEEGKGV